MQSKTMYGKNLFTLASRERCMTKIKTVLRPVITPKKIDVPPKATAAVLVPMCCINDVATLLYTVRSTKLKNHGGQVSFPGGKSDKSETLVQTALRETKEEIGLSPEKIDIWGQGPAVPSRDNKTMITPIIGSIKDLNSEDLTINHEEVEELFAVSIETLCNPNNQYYTQFRNGFILPVFVADEYKIWGITAYITHIFLSALLTKDAYSNEWTKKRIVIKDIHVENIR